MAGLDEELGLFESQNEAAQRDGSVVDIEEGRKKTRKQFHYWEVGDEEYRLKLTTQMITKLEDKYRCNLLNIVSVDGMPRLSIMLTVIQAAMSPWHHGTKYKTVENIYDRYLAAGGSQVKLLADVIMPTMAVSGFFTENQTEELLDKMKSLDEVTI